MNDVVVDESSAPESNEPFTGAKIPASDAVSDDDTPSLGEIDVVQVHADAEMHDNSAEAEGDAIKPDQLIDREMEGSQDGAQAEVGTISHASTGPGHSTTLEPAPKSNKDESTELNEFKDEDDSNKACQNDDESTIDHPLKVAGLGRENAAHVSICSDADMPADECENNVIGGNQVNQQVNTRWDNGTSVGNLEDGEEADDDNFVAIELASPKESHQSAADNEPKCNPDEMEVQQQTTEIPTSHSNPKPSPTLPATAGIRRKRIFRHPILTPLTKLPWDRFISAAGACDVLFNCKYSMRQVEDEVREDARRIGAGEMHLLGNGGASENRVGREDGYTNVSLGNECGDYHHYGEQGCEAEEFAEMGLGCCSMLDEETDDELEGVANGRLPQNEGGQQEQQQQISIGLNAGEEQEYDEMDEPQVQRTAAAASPTTTQAAPPPTVMTDDQKADISWKHSNPSLDMMFYRTMLNE